MSAGTWWYRLIPSWAPSWLVELVSGLVTVAIARAVAQLVPRRWRALVTALLATALGVIYELLIDVNGWSLSDVLQREAGIAAGLLVLFLGRLL